MHETQITTTGVLGRRHQRFVSKSETKEPNHLSLSHTNRGIMRFCQAHSAPATAFVTDLDTPHHSKALCMSGTAWEVAFAGVTTATLTQIRTGRSMLHRRPALLEDRHSFCRAGPT